MYKEALNFKPEYRPFQGYTELKTNQIYLDVALKDVIGISTCTYFTYEVIFFFPLS